jgi:hypothetical protein
MIISVALPIVKDIMGAVGEMFFKPLFANQFGRNYIDVSSTGTLFAFKNIKVNE